MMSNHRSTQGSQQVASLIASGRFQTERSLPDTGTSSLRCASAEISDELLARHLVEVALLARDERDFRLAEHLVDIAYHLASRE